MGTILSILTFIGVMFVMQKLGLGCCGSHSHHSDNNSENSSKKSCCSSNKEKVHENTFGK